MADGVYSIAEPFVLTPQDSGTKSCPISYENAPGASPVISGGRTITGFQLDRRRDLEGGDPRSSCGPMAFRAVGGRWRPRSACQDAQPLLRLYGRHGGSACGGQARSIPPHDRRLRQDHSNRSRGSAPRNFTTSRWWRSTNGVSVAGSCTRSTPTPTSIVTIGEQAEELFRLARKHSVPSREFQGGIGHPRRVVPQPHGNTLLHALARPGHDQGPSRRPRG